MVGCMLDMSTQLVLFSQIAISNRYIAMGHPQYFHIMIHVLPVLLIIPECGSIMIYPDLAPQKKTRAGPPDATGPRWDRDSASIDPRYPGHGQSWQKKTSRVHLYVRKVRYCSGGCQPQWYTTFISQKKLGSLNNTLGIGFQWATPFYSRPRCRFLGERDCVSWRNSVSYRTWPSSVARGGEAPKKI